MSISMHASRRERRARMREAEAAIGRQLHADYFPVLAEPLPDELKELVAQLVAIDRATRVSTERAVELRQSTVLHPGPRDK